MRFSKMRPGCVGTSLLRTRVMTAKTHHLSTFALIYHRKRVHAVGAASVDSSGAGQTNQPHAPQFPPPDHLVERGSRSCGAAMDPGCINERRSHSSSSILSTPAHVDIDKSTTTAGARNAHEDAGDKDKDRDNDDWLLFGHEDAASDVSYVSSGEFVTAESRAGTPVSAYRPQGEDFEAKTRPSNPELSAATPGPGAALPRTVKPVEQPEATILQSQDISGHTKTRRILSIDRARARSILLPQAISPAQNVHSHCTESAPPLRAAATVDHAVVRISMIAPEIEAAKRGRGGSPYVEAATVEVAVQTFPALGEETFGTPSEDSTNAQDNVVWHCRVCKGNPCRPVATACGHIFCQRCIIRELVTAGSCPVCRKLFFVHLDVGV